MSFRRFFVAGLCALVGASSGSGCGGGGGFPTDAASTVTTGTVTLAWAITDPGGAPLTCDQVGANTIAMQLQGQTTAGVLISLSCAAGSGQSQPIAPDTYSVVSVELHGAKLDPVAGAKQTGIVVRSGADTALARVTFQVNPNGAIAFSITAPQATTNCGATASGGAGISATTITLQHDVTGPCEPVTFTHTKGATTLDSYTVNCTSPTVADCIERDEALSVATMPSGNYTVHIVGKINNAACWTNNDALVVPPQGKTQSGTWNLALDTTDPSCPRH
jgi:hypothetical protein